MNIRCIIIDDEELARTLLSNYILRTPGLELVGSYKSPLEVINRLPDLNIDLIFLDIQMPDLTGIEFLRILKSIKPFIVFSTAYSQYAIEGFELDVVDYLVKPFSFERFLHCIRKVSFMMANHDNSSGSESHHIIIKSGNKIFKILPDEILYIEGLREYVSYYTTDNRRLIALESLKELEIKLARYNFIRVHKSYIINVSKVKVINGNQIIIAGKEIPLGNNYKEKALAQILHE